MSEFSTEASIDAPTDLFPTDEISTDLFPTDLFPTNEISTDEISTDEISTDEISTDEIYLPHLDIFDGKELKELKNDLLSSNNDLLSSNNDFLLKICEVTLKPGNGSYKKNDPYYCYEGQDFPEILLKGKFSYFIQFEFNIELLESDVFTLKLINTNIELDMLFDVYIKGKVLEFKFSLKGSLRKNFGNSRNDKSFLVLSKGEKIIWKSSKFIIRARKKPKKQKPKKLLMPLKNIVMLLNNNQNGNYGASSSYNNYNYHNGRITLNQMRQPNYNKHPEPY